MKHASISEDGIPRYLILILIMQLQSAIYCPSLILHFDLIIADKLYGFLKNELSF